MMGQMQQSAGVYFGAAATPYAGQAPGTPTLSHMSPQTSAGGGYPSSPGHSNGYGMQTAQQVSGIPIVM